MASARNDQTDLSRRALLKTAAAGVGAVALGFPAIVRSQPDALRIGHLTPRTGFLGQLGEYGLNAASLAVEETNAAGGVLGRKVELIAEDSVNPGVAVTKVQKLVERDKVLCLLGEISSASALAIAEQANRYKVPYINTGANSDELRGKNCSRFMFHVEGCNTMYTKTIGLWQRSKNLIRGAKWYMLTADYAFGHDLFRVSTRFLTENGGSVLTNDMVPTNTADYSAYILKIRQAKPDFVYINLAGTDQTTFLKQYKEYNLPFPLAGGVMDTVPFWAAGIDSLSGHWQSLWYHGLTVPAARAFTKRFGDKYGKPPDNQAWGDYVGVKILLRAMAETKSTEGAKWVAYFEQGASFDILKGRPGSFRKWDHQLLQEMYVVKVKDKKDAKDKWDIFELVQPVPAANDSLELIQPTQKENPCTLA
ncbi:MAG: ABC transporter substrate-binding protein [Candidatus Rokubacteria bacterium]|nr:ABC transporter substrate-binding protein [Candidatus Rokubacteria bacterium]MBI2158236.1 ABC transporter substrate-binding protein [Candidatus Rokubacteria bacterium]